MIALVAVEACGGGTGILALPPSFLKDTVLGIVLLLCPAMILLGPVGLGRLIERSSIIYPVTLAAGFWVAREASHPLAYAIFLVYFLMPVALFYTLLLIWSFWRNCKRPAMTGRL